jgi:hypothetical protein
MSMRWIPSWRGVLERQAGRLRYTLLGLLGGGALVGLVRALGTDQVALALTRVIRLVPLLVAVEIGRMGCEMIATRSLAGGVPTRLLVRAQLNHRPRSWDIGTG